MRMFGYCANFNLKWKNALPRLIKLMDVARFRRTEQRMSPHCRRRSYGTPNKIESVEWYQLDTRRQMLNTNVNDRQARRRLSSKTKFPTSAWKRSNEARALVFEDCKDTGIIVASSLDCRPAQNKPISGPKRDEHDVTASSTEPGCRVQNDGELINISGCIYSLIHSDGGRSNSSRPTISSLGYTTLWYGLCKRNPLYAFLHSLAPRIIPSFHGLIVSEILVRWCNEGEEGHISL